MRRLGRWPLILTTILLTAGLVTGPPGTTPAEAAPGDMTITGHGYGHGRGLSQWGAYGYATRSGWNHRQILSHYYGNATVGNIGNPVMTVRITGLDNVVSQVTSTAAFTVGGTSLPGGTVAQVTRNGDGSWQLSTRYVCNGPVVWNTRITSTAMSTNAHPGDDISKMLTVCQTKRAYRGTLSVVSDGGALRTINTIYMQDYLRGVIPKEASAAWGSAPNGLQALMAQAVAARSYAWADNRYPYAKTCDTTACQVYGGAGLNGARIEDGRTDLASYNTGGEVMMLNGSVARTEFSASSGGYTAGGTFPAVRDDGDLAASPYANWSVKVPSATISNAFGVGTLRSVTVLARNGLGAEGGRVTKVRVTGADKTVEVTGSAFRSALGLRSDWFTPGAIEPPPPPPLKDISPVALSAVRTGAGSVVAFVRGNGGWLYYTTAVNGTFGAYQALPAGTRSGPAAVSTDGTRIDLFVVGTDRALWHTASTVGPDGRPTGFGGWTSLGGLLTTAPAVASNAAGGIVVSARGTDGSMFVRTLQAGTWTGWQAVGGVSDSAPALEVVDAATTRLLVVGSDGAIWARELSAATGAPTTGWASTGRRTGFAPAVSGNTWSALAIRALAVSNGSAVRQVWADGRVVDVGGVVTSAVALVEVGPSETWTLVRGTDGALWVNVVTDPAAPSRWTKVGGVLT